MYLYILLFIILAGFSFIDLTNISILKKQYLLFIIGVGTILFFGGRFECDNDYNNYIYFYEQTPPLYEITWSDFIKLYLGFQVEPLFFFFSSFFKTLEFSGQAIILFYAFCTFSIIINFIKNTTQYPLTAFFLYTTCYFSLPFMQMRFGLSAACCLYAFLNLENKSKYWKWQIIAILFHMTAIIGIGFYIFQKFNLSLKKSIILLILSFFFVFLPIRSLFTIIINSIGMSRYLNYLNEDSISLSSCIMHIILFSPLIIFQNSLREYIYKFDLFLKMAVFAIILMAATTQLPILNRFSILFATSSCVSITFYFFLIRENRLNLVLTWILFITYAFLKFYPSLNHINPYQLYFTSK